jgi:hypothetical protein
MKRARSRWFTPIILATQEAEIRIAVQSQLTQNSVQDRISKKNITKKGWLVEWLKVQALSSNPSTEKKENKRGLGMLDWHATGPGFDPQHASAPARRKKRKKDVKWPPQI